MPSLFDAAPARFLLRVRVKNKSACWVWLGIKDKDGYGLFWWEGQQVKAHRFVLGVLLKKKIVGKYVCHHCDNPACVNPNHLYVGTASSNAQDRELRGRGVKGRKQTALHVQRKADACRGKKRSKEFCDRIAKIRTGSKASDAARMSMSKARRGVPRPDLIGVLAGEKNGNARLTTASVTQIRLSYATGTSQALLARKYAVGHNTISRIVHGDSWKHLL